MNFADEKWSYEQKRAFRYGLQDYMHESFGFEKWNGKRVLDYGCGSGIDSVEFARNGAIVTAVDITDNAMSLTKALAEEAGVRLIVLKVNGQAIPFKDETFDCIYSFGCLHHIPDAERTLKGMHRVLKIGGTIMAMLYHRDSLLFAYSIAYLHGLTSPWMLNKFNLIKLTSQYSERIEGCPYTKAYTKDEARELFERHFTDVSVEVHYNVIDTPEQRKVKLGIEDKWELGWHLVVKGRKGKR